MAELLLLLIAGHYLADFPLQPDFVARMKSRVFFESIGFHCLTAHAMIHGLVAAAVVTALGHEQWVPAFGVVAISHWLIDFGKAWDGWPDSWRITQGAKVSNPDARGLYGINVDQALHLLVMVALALGVTHA